MSTPRRVLVVDDDPVLMDVLVFQMGRLGHQTWSAATVEEALAVVDSTALDAVVTDLHLGAQTCEPVAAAAASRGIDLVIITGTPEAGDRIREIAPEARIVGKPASLSDLADALL